MGLGDALMDSGAARIAQMKDPRKVKIVWGTKGVVWSEIWENNPRIAKPNEEGDFQMVFGRDRLKNMRPYHTSKSEQRWTYNLDFRAVPGEIYFGRSEVQFGTMHSPQIIVEPNIKSKASPNKNWGWDRWQTFAYMAAAEGIHLSQLGPRGTRTLNSVRLIETPTFRQACAVLGRAKAYVGHEGGLHHAAAALNVPGVVIFGNFTPVELTGYPMHRNIGASLGDACGMRVPCPCCDKAMAAIAPEQILNELKGVLSAA